MNSLLIDALPQRLEALLQAPSPPLVCVVGLGNAGQHFALQTAALRQGSGAAAYRVIALADPEQQLLLAQFNQAQFSAGAGAALSVPHNLLATSDPMVLRQAETILLDLSALPPAAWPAQCQQIGRRMAADALLILLGPLPPGCCENTLLPLLQAAFSVRDLSETPLLALLMPQSSGWFMAGNVPLATQRARDFLERLQPADTLLQSLPELKTLEVLSTLQGTYRALSSALQQDWRALAASHGVALEPLLALLPWQMPPSEPAAPLRLPPEMQRWQQVLGVAAS